MAVELLRHPSSFAEQFNFLFLHYSTVFLSSISFSLLIEGKFFFFFSFSRTLSVKVSAIVHGTMTVTDAQSPDVDPYSKIPETKKAIALDRSPQTPEAAVQLAGGGSLPTTQSTSPTTERSLRVLTIPPIICVITIDSFSGAIILVSQHHQNLLKLAV